MELNGGDIDRGDGTDQHARWGIEHSIRPGSPVPPTLLVAEVGNGALLLQGWQTGPSAYLTAEDAEQVRHALAVAFGNDPPAGDVGAGVVRDIGTEGGRPLTLPEYTVKPDWEP